MATLFWEKPQVMSIVYIFSSVLMFLYIPTPFPWRLLSKATYNKNICQKKEKQQYIAVGTVILFIEASAKH